MHSILIPEVVLNFRIYPHITLEDPEYVVLPSNRPTARLGMREEEDLVYA